MKEALREVGVTLAWGFGVCGAITAVVGPFVWLDSIFPRFLEHLGWVFVIGVFVGMVGLAARMIWETCQEDR